MDDNLGNEIGTDIDRETGRFRQPPGKGEIIGGPFGGGVIGVFIGVIFLAIGVSILNRLTNSIHSLDVPLISHIFSPDFRDNIWGHLVFGFTALTLFVLTMLVLLFAIKFIKWVFGQ